MTARGFADQKASTCSGLPLPLASGRRLLAHQPVVLLLLCLLLVQVFWHISRRATCKPRAVEGSSGQDGQASNTGLGKRAY